MTRVLRAEWIKLRRSGVWPVCVLTPYVIVLFFALFAYFDGERFLRPDRAWTWLIMSTLRFFAGVVLPLWVAAITAQVAAIEHRSRGFKHLFVLPVARWRLYLGKQIVGWGLCLVVMLGLAVALLVAGSILGWLRPELGFDAFPELAPLLVGAFGTTLASGFLIAIHTWVALVRSDLMTPIALGFVATISVVALGAFDADLVVFHPWAYPTQWVKSLDGTIELVWPLVGAATGALLAMVAGWSFVARDVET
ncbi:MAG: ABC transporter permease [Acidobacteriota bacterium]